ncbi:MAG TPA: Flp pilus assembly protein CpaB [Gaiellaceae bacterium]|jgi:pilus assembly protein CpaB|nr:Flp pilus assembly protein CpaB [Gaiellaceae bacterium]
MTYRVKNIGIAVILAAFAGLLTIVYVTSYKRHVQNGEKNVTVLVAARDIPAGTSGSEVVEQHYLRTETVARRAVVPGAISKPDQLNNLVVTQQVFRGEQVTTRSFGTQTELGVRAQVRANERVYQLSGDDNQLLAGTLKDGDHVDVVATWNVPEGATHHVSRVILHNLLVLKAPDAPTGTKVTSPEGGSSVQLRVTDSQSERLLWASENGKVSLELRPPADARESRPSVQDSLTLTRSR